tara:strand:- start:90 stop:257 length:168 start_codon:yes stop_codon:yes gene_type:complete
MTFEQETLQEIYNLCSHYKSKEGNAGTLAKMICDKVESTKNADYFALRLQKKDIR